MHDPQAGIELASVNGVQIVSQAGREESALAELPFVQDIQSADGGLPRAHRPIVLQRLALCFHAVDLDAFG